MFTSHGSKQRLSLIPTFLDLIQVPKGVVVQMAIGQIARMCVFHFLMMMIVFITFKSSLVPLIEGLCSSNPCACEFSDFRRNRTDDLGINSPSL